MPKINHPTYSGSCLCASIRYEVDKLEPKMAHCHCSMCRKFHGAAFATFGEARTENFRWTSGEEFLKSYRAENGTTRQFCEKCGSSLIFKPSVNNEDFVEFALGTLDSDIPLQPDAHIYVGSKANWVELHDALPKYLKGRSEVSV